MSRLLSGQSSGHPFIKHRSSFTLGLMNGFKEPTPPRNAPTGQMRLQKYLLSLSSEWLWLLAQKASPATTPSTFR